MGKKMTSKMQTQVNPRPIGPGVPGVPPPTLVGPVRELGAEGNPFAIREQVRILLGYRSPPHVQPRVVADVVPLARLRVVDRRISLVGLLVGAVPTHVVADVPAIGGLTDDARSVDAAHDDLPADLAAQEHPKRPPIETVGDGDLMVHGHVAVSVAAASAALDGHRNMLHDGAGHDLVTDNEVKHPASTALTVGPSQPVLSARLRDTIGREDGVVPHPEGHGPLAVTR